MDVSESAEISHLKSGSPNFPDEKHNASLLLINREFDNCIDLCHKALNSLKSTLNCNGIERHDEEIEEFVVIIVQAYAELERWQEVLPYITDLYSGIENVSPNILKLCLLLHAKVREYSTCSAVYNIWMRPTEDRQVQEIDMKMLADVYISRVLIPAGNSSQITSFIESSRLEEPSKERLLSSYTDLVNTQSAQLTTDLTPPEQSSQTESHTPQNIVDRMIERTFRVLKIVVQWLWSIRPRSTSRAITTVVCLVAIVMTFQQGIDWSNSTHYLHMANVLQYLMFGRSAASN